MNEIPLSKPDITDLERKAVMEVLQTSVLSLGKKYKEFQGLVADFSGVKYSIAVNSGTSGLHLIIRALDIEAGDEIITTPFSFIASSNCILYEKAKPIFVDIEEDTFNINPSLIEKKITSKTKAILVADIFSHPANWDALEKVAKKYKLFLIEDSAEALGSEYMGKKCGSFGDAAVFAFYPNKQITTGEGGMILTNNKKIAELCQSMANQGRKIKRGKWLEHERLGYNYRMNELSAALGISQIKRIKEILEKKSFVAETYNRKLKGMKEVELPFIAAGAKISWFVYVVKLSERLAGKRRDKIIQEMGKKGIRCSNYFQPIHLQPFYRREFGFKENDFPVSENIGKRTLALPFFNSLTEKEIDFVARNLKNIISVIK